MNLQESIRRILKEDSLKQYLIDEIKEVYGYSMIR